MGHTVASQRQMIDIVLADLRDLRMALRTDERLLIDRILKEPLKHVGAISHASSIDIWAMILLSILLEQEKKIGKLEEKIDRLDH